MSITNGVGRFAAAVFAALAISGASAVAEEAAGLIQVDFTNVAFAQTAGPTSIPIGHVDFCQRYRAECGAHAGITPAAALSQPLWEQLVAVNNRINSEII